MPRQDEFARDWTYRTPLKTIAYPKGYRAVLPREVQLAARRARALVPPTLPVAPKPRARRKKAAE